MRIENNILFNNLAIEAESISDYKLFSLYCSTVIKGLRKQALGHLLEFLDIAEKWSYEKQRDFVQWFFERIEGQELEGLVQPLLTRLLQPVLFKWLEIEPDDPRPNRWLGLYITDFPSDDYCPKSFLRRAIQLDPTDEVSKHFLIQLIIQGLKFSIHELPEGYCGEIKEDIDELKELYNLIDNLADKKAAVKMKQEAYHLSKVIEMWCREKGIEY